MKIPLIRRSVLVVVAGILVTLLSPLAASAQKPADGVTCNLPESNAEGWSSSATSIPATGGTTPT